jgi:putative transcription factor
MSIISGQDWEPVVLNNTKKDNIEKKNIVKENVDDIIEKKNTVSLSNSLLIQKSRINKKLSQKDLAQKLNIDSKIIQSYECGKAIPEFNIMIKLEKILGIKLNKKKNQK